MSEISGKLLGIVATVAVFVVAIMIAVYPKIESQGDEVGEKMESVTNRLNQVDATDWNVD